MSLLAQIMNLPAKPAKVNGNNYELAYKEGHRDARHAAAELVEEYAGMYKDLLTEVERCSDIAQSMDVMNPTLAGAFTGTPSEWIRRQLYAMAEKS